MSKLKHTKGKWIYEQSEEYSPEYEIMKDGYTIASVYSGVEMKTEAVYDAQLIATAPEMLELLIELYKYLDDNSYNTFDLENISNIIEDATGLKIEEVINENEN